MIDARKKELLQRGTAFFPIQYYYTNTASPLYNLPVHWHVEYELIHVLEGDLNIFVDGNEMALGPGSLCVVQDGILHGGGQTKAASVFESLVFDFNLLRSKNYAHDTFLEDVASHKAILDTVIPVESEDIRMEVKQLFDVMRNEPCGYELMTVACLLYLFGYIKNNKFYTVHDGVQDKSRLRNEQLKAVFNLIHGSYGTPLSLEDMAGAAAMSPKYFCRVFKEMTSRTPVEYLNSYRIDQACEQLRKGNESLIDVAYNCGFNDFSYFIKTFKRYKGMTPHKYRNFDIRENLSETEKVIQENELSRVNLD